MTGAAILALAVVTGCSSATEASVAAPAPTSPTVAPSPTESASPSESPAAAGSATLTKPGTTLKFGEAANVKVDFAGSEWTGGLKVTGLEKAPAADYKELGVREDSGTVYYLRYDVTYLAGATKFPPEGSNVSWTDLHPVSTTGARLSLINVMGFKKCTTGVYADDGGVDTDKARLKIGETATNMCLPFTVDKGTVTQVVHSFWDLDKKADQTITWE
jgi:hypothetical protein